MSFDYTLLHLYIPWFLLVLLAVKAQREGVSVVGLTPTFILLAFGLAPLSELIFRGERFGGEVRAILLSALLALGLYFPFPVSGETTLA